MVSLHFTSLTCFFLTHLCDLSGRPISCFQLSRKQRLKLWGDRALTAATPKLWNELLSHYSLASDTVWPVAFYCLFIAFFIHVFNLSKVWSTLSCFKPFMNNFRSNWIYLSPMTHAVCSVSCASWFKRIHGGVEVLEQEEGGDDDEHQEESVVVEDGEGGGLVVCHLVLLPQDPESSKHTVNHRLPQHRTFQWHKSHYIVRKLREGWQSFKNCQNFQNDTNQHHCCRPNLILTYI